MDYGATDIVSVMERLTAAQTPGQELDVLVWMHAGIEWDGASRREPRPYTPYGKVRGVDLHGAVAMGLGGIASTYDLPSITDDLGFAVALVGRWFSSATVELRTGASAHWHRAEIVFKETGSHVGVSRCGPAAAVLAALLRALHAEGRQNRWPLADRKTAARENSGVFEIGVDEVSHPPDH